MAQMRVLKKHAESEFSAENGAAYTAVMLHTVEQISPEIYENYRELLDNFRSAVKCMLWSSIMMQRKISLPWMPHRKRYSAMPYRRHVRSIYC